MHVRVALPKHATTARGAGRRRRTGASACAQGRRADQAASAGPGHIAGVCTWSTDRGLFALLKMLALVPFDFQ
jgi:hypothetical protein